MSPVDEPAPAKINLALHVTGRRGDGYHLLDSLVVFAAAGDLVRLTPAEGASPAVVPNAPGPADGPSGEATRSPLPRLTVDGPFAGAVPVADNLCLRAAALVGADVAIHLTKRLPVAAGIGGGSADAAGVLRGLARLGYPLPARPERLGADVPVCLGAPLPARMRGVGEVVGPLAPLPRLPMVLCNPGVPLATPAVFAGLTSRDNAPLPPIPAFADASALIGWLGTCRNDLEAPAAALVPAITDVLTALRAGGAALARMSGSGATCFGLFTDPAAAKACAARLSAQGWWAVATTTL